MGSHRDLIAYQVARESVVALYRFADRNWQPQRAAIFDQVRRSSLSVQLNLAEGYASGRGARCRHLFRIAHASAVETSEVLELLGDLGHEVGELIALSRRTEALTYRLWQRSRV